MNPEFDLTSLSATAVEHLAPFEETDGSNDDDDTFFKSRSKSKIKPSTSKKKIDDVDMNDATIER